MSKITTKTFTSVLSAAVKAHGSTRDSIQSLCVFAMNQAGNGNYTYINAIMNADFKGADQRAQQKYFEDHCDVTLGRIDGKFAFKNNKSKGFSYIMPTKAWFDYKPTATPTVIEPISAILALINRMENALNNKGTATVAKGKTQQARDLITYIRKQPDIFKANQASKAAKAIAA